MWKHESIAEINEASLVERLVQDAHWRWRLFNVKGMESASALRTRVPLSGLPGNLRGDIDILLIPPGRPESATAIQVKKIKVGRRALTGGRPNKMRELDVAIRQANILARAGFSQVYLYVFVVVDSRVRNTGRISYEGPPAALRNSIAAEISPVGLAPRVGLMHFEFVQPMDYEALSVGTFSGHLIRLAAPTGQPQEVTEWVATFDAPRVSSHSEHLLREAPHSRGAKMGDLVVIRKTVPT